MGRTSLEQLITRMRDEELPMAFYASDEPGENSVLLLANVDKGFSYIFRTRQEIDDFIRAATAAAAQAFGRIPPQG